MFKVETNSEFETEKMAERLAAFLKPGDVITLDGDLGTGKTVFSRGIARGLGVKEPITSPTFIIMQEYRDGRIPLFHFDVYRIESIDEIFAIGTEEYIGGDGVCVIEWAKKIEELIPKDAIHINIKRNNDIGFDYRLVEIDGFKGNAAAIIDL